MPSATKGFSLWKPITIAVYYDAHWFRGVRGIDFLQNPLLIFFILGGLGWQHLQATRSDRGRGGRPEALDGIGHNAATHGHPWNSQRGRLEAL